MGTDCISKGKSRDKYDSATLILFSICNCHISSVGGVGSGVIFRQTIGIAKVFLFSDSY